MPQEYRPSLYSILHSPQHENRAPCPQDNVLPSCRPMHSGGFQAPRALNPRCASKSEISTHAGAKLTADAEAAPSPRSPVAGLLATRILFCSSLLFLLPLAYAISNAVWDVVIGQAATAVTSLLNHWFMSKNAFFNRLDKVVVRSIAFYFMVISYWVLPPQHLAFVLVSSSIALAVYVLYSRHHQCRTQTHVIVHVASNVGVWLYTAGILAQRLPESADGNS